MEGTVKCVLKNTENPSFPSLYGIVYDSQTIARLYIENEKKRFRSSKKTNFNNNNNNNNNDNNKNDDFENKRRKNILDGFETVNFEVLQKLRNNFHLKSICLNKTNKNNFEGKNSNIRKEDNMKIKNEKNMNEENRKRDEKNILRQLITRAEQSSKKIENMELNHVIELKKLSNEIKNLTENHQKNFKENEEERENSRKRRRKEKETITEQNLRIVSKSKELSDLKRFSLEMKKENSKKFENFEQQIIQLKK